jgi:hypothetical protein
MYRNDTGTRLATKGAQAGNLCRGPVARCIRRKPFNFSLFSSAIWQIKISPWAAATTIDHCPSLRSERGTIFYCIFSANSIKREANRAVCKVQENLTLVGSDLLGPRVLGVVPRLRLAGAEDDKKGVSGDVDGGRNEPNGAPLLRIVLRENHTSKYLSS